VPIVSRTACKSAREQSESICDHDVDGVIPGKQLTPSRIQGKRGKMYLLIDAVAPV
jgi:hypothetical protein